MSMFILMGGGVLFLFFFFACPINGKVSLICLIDTALYISHNFFAK